MQGLFLRRLFAEPAPPTATITVTGSGANGYFYLIMPDGTEVVSAGTYEVPLGGIIVCRTNHWQSFITCAVYLNGTQMVGGLSGSGKGAEYRYTVTGAATIDLTNALIRITEG